MRIFKEEDDEYYSKSGFAFEGDFVTDPHYSKSGDILDDPSQYYGIRYLKWILYKIYRKLIRLKTK